MISRRAFLAGMGSTLLYSRLAGMGWQERPISAFSKHLHPVGRALEMKDWYVWCNSPVEGEDGKIHVFFSRWPAKLGMGGWIKGSEIAHAVADHPEKPFTFVQTVLSPRGPGYWDATTCHNPNIQKIGNKYYLFYMGNSNGKTDTKRIGLAIADSPYGPWQRSDTPLLEAGAPGDWDDHCTTNPALVHHPNGEYWLYYKSWNTADYERDAGKPIRGNRKYGLAIAQQPEGPYHKYPHNPLIDFSGLGDNKQLEDAFVWYGQGRFNMLARDMGVYDQRSGLYMEAKDGLKWSLPSIAYYDAAHYHIQEPAPPASLKRYGRFERPQLLMLKGKPAYMFTAAQGGQFMTASSFIFRIK
ncbi:family 43 glycosylhydrolase [Chitinophaga agrisoli]|uniref:Family 43 glycosylhydrolase n=1 Tax=Chitinophaga agrisoli TaxID=2607653 RepID=A0A5B2VPB5_9BACT|nr:glycoside hydrolase family protein [Chitinophaga agrisoli]KAA2240037.1 family 43 glycosylhydrolase [Chitinophaga agrisoli]